MIFSYLLINLFTLAGPLARSFEPKIQYWRKWKPLFAAIGLTLLFFVLWDALFTKWGIWGFTPTYLVGIQILGLPVEEWLFFVTIPYACVFIYEVLNHFIYRDLLGNSAKWISCILICLGGGILILFRTQLYTQSSVVVMMALLIFNAFVRKSRWLGRFFLAYLLSLVPFFIVNGILTGAITSEPIVWYNDAENMGIRIITIPIEDFIYGMDLMLLNVMLYEFFKHWMRIEKASLRYSTE